jgi:hypothetical protein
MPDLYIRNYDFSRVAEYREHVSNFPHGTVWTVFEEKIISRSASNQVSQTAVKTTVWEGLNIAVKIRIARPNRANISCYP